MKVYVLGFTLASCVNILLATDVRLVDLDPNDAAQVINSQDQSLRYAPKVDSHVPAVRYLGNQQQRVLEDIYLANQYHGQDGLGAYIYGYSVPDIAKTEKKERSGDLKGAYEYIAGNGQEIKVQYWDDGTGFHQIDNVPKNLPEDDPDVKAAKEEHLRIWHEQALRNSRPPVDPNQRYYEQQQPQSLQHYQTQGVITQTVNHQPNYVALNQLHQPSVPQVPQIPQVPNLPLGSNSIEYAGQYSSNQQTYARAASTSQPSTRVANTVASEETVRSRNSDEQPWAQGPAASASQVASQQTWAPQGFGAQSVQVAQESRTGSVSVKQEQDEEESGPPKGFFYSFDYPVGIIVGKDGQQALNTIYNQNKEYHEQQLKPHASA